MTELVHPLPHVVIVGGGFAGIHAARALRRAPVRVTVVDRRNHHLFQPLLYQVATAALNPADIASPIRRVLRRHENAEVLLAEVAGFDLERRRVLLDAGELSYDALIVAAGASHSYFGHDEWAPYAPGLKTIEDALEIRRRVFMAFEAAERESDPSKRTQWLTFVVVGAGPTGVELAGTLAWVARWALRGNFRRIRPGDARVVLIEMGNKVLPTYGEPLPEKAREQLEALGVEVRLGTRVTGIDDGGVQLGDVRLEAATVLWGAGVKASTLGAALGAALDRNGRVCVEKDLSVPGAGPVFVAGDLAHVEQDGQLVPGVAAAAIQMGRHAALNAARLVHGNPTVPFHYRNKGVLAVIGRGAAVADLGRVRFAGRFAWLLWLGVHITYLIGFRNRLLVLVQWAWAYFTFERGARLITGVAPPRPELVTRDVRASHGPSRRPSVPRPSRPSLQV